MNDVLKDESDFQPNQSGGLPENLSKADHPSQKTSESILKNQFSGIPSKDEIGTELRSAHRNWKNENRATRSL